MEDAEERVAAARREAMLVGRAQRGDDEAFAALVCEHQVLVQRWLLARCVPGIEAEDLAQQAFMLAWEQLADYRGTGAFGSWVVGIAANLLRREYRRLQQHSRLHAQLADRWLAQVAVEAPADRLTDELEQLEACLQELEPSLGAVVELHYRQQRRVAGIASALGRPVGTVKRQLHHARRLLSDCLHRRLRRAERPV